MSNEVSSADSAHKKDPPSKPPQSKAEVFRARLLSTLILWGLVTAAFVIGRPEVFAGLVVVLSALGLWEYARLLKLSGFKSGGAFGLAGLVGVIVLVGLALALIQKADGTEVTMGFELGGLVVIALGAFILWMRFPIEGRRSLDAVTLSLFGYVYVAVLFGAFVLRLLFEAPGLGETPGLWLVLFTIVATKFTDMGAYITGSLIGKNKMCPHLSPKKTWEGFFGALVFAQLGAWGMWKLAGETLSWMEPWHVGVLGVVLALLAVVGDLAESILKRSLEIKDSGQVLPGIGGVLDLIDSICFTAPVVYLYMLFTS